MADPTAAVRSYLLNNTSTAITSLVGSGVHARIIPGELSQDCQMPAITYEDISDTPEHVIGTEWGRSGFSRARIAFTCYASTPTQSKLLARTLMAHLCGPIQRLRGVYGGVNFLDAMVDYGPRSETDAPTDGSDERRYLTTIEIMFSYYDE